MFQPLRQLSGWMACGLVLCGAVIALWAGCNPLTSPSADSGVDDDQNTVTQTEVTEDPTDDQVLAWDPQSPSETTSETDSTVTPSTPVVPQSDTTNTVDPGSTTDPGDTTNPNTPSSDNTDSGNTTPSYTPFVPTGEAYYVAPDGLTTNDGTRDRPWPTAEYALSKVGGGKTIVVRPGNYAYIKIYAAASGTQDSPTLIISEIKWAARLVGPAEHGIYSPEDDAAQALHDVVLDGFEIDGGNHEAITYDGAHFVYDQRIVVRNCWVHHARHMGVAMHGCSNSTLERNLIEVNGTDPSTGVPQHHGVYASGRRLLIQANVVRANTGFGLHLYSAIADSVITHNLVYDHPRGTGILVQSPTGGGANRVTYNTSVRNSIGIGIRMGRGEVVVGNTIAENSLYTLLMPSDTSESIFDWNLCDPPPSTNPKAVYSGVGSHNISAAPRFVNSAAGVFYLRSDSPGVSAGDPSLAPLTDFWGRPSSDGAPDLGAFPYEPQFEGAQGPISEWWITPRLQLWRSSLQTSGRSSIDPPPSSSR